MTAHTDERAVPIFPGDDLGGAKAFYVNRLGFEVEWEDTADGRTGIMGIRRGGIELVIDCPMTGHGRNVCASIRVNDADAYYAEWRDKVEIGRPPVDEVWGGRTFGITDPSGNLLFMIGPIPDSAMNPADGASSAGPPEEGEGIAYGRTAGVPDQKTQPHVTSFAPQFLVDDLVRSMDYYRKLGFTFDDPWEGFYAIGQLDGFELHLKEAPRDGPERQQRRENEHLDAAAGVHGIEAFYERCIATGVTIVRPLEATAWGTKNFYVEDPDGHIIAFGGRPS